MISQWAEQRNCTCSGVAALCRIRIYGAYGH